MRSVALLAAAALAQLGTASTQETHHALHQKRQSNTVSVTGVKDGQTGTRQEISTLASNTDAYNLFLLAMQRFQNDDTNDILSYYQISGIHGLPCAPYSGVNSNSDATSQGGCGYCHHSTPLFPAWHRIYVALFEQGFAQQVQGVISDFSGNPSQQAAFTAAAPGLRFPYWDWAANPAGNGPSIPTLITDSTVTVPAASGGTTSIPNPLYSYHFQILDQSDTGGDPWDNWQNTLRYPTTSDSSSTSDESTCIADIQQGFASTQSNTYKMLINCTQWEEMADDSAQTSSPGCSAGLESIHDNIHNVVGGGGNGGAGHMTDLGHAGFDPIFWLHHTNVDRLLALWQVAQNQAWFTPGSSGVPTYTTPANTQVDGTFGLTPFYRDAGSQTFWTPNDLQDWTTLGYTYPEVSSGPGSDKNAAISAINSLYGTQTVSSTQQQQTSSSSASSASSASATDGSSSSAGSSSASSPVGGQTGIAGPTGIIPNPSGSVSNSAIGSAISAGASGASSAGSSAASDLSGGSSAINSAISAILGGASSAASGASGVAIPTGGFQLPTGLPTSVSSQISSMISSAQAAGQTDAAAISSIVSSALAALGTGFPSVTGTNSSSSLTPLPSNLGSLLTPQGRVYDWSCNIITERMGLGGSYSIYVFLGTVPSDSSQWGSAPGLCGTHGIFASQSMGTASGVLVSGAVSLTHCLVQQIAAGNLKGLDASVVNPFLQANLSWRVKKATGQVIDNNVVPGLAVSVANAKVMPAANSGSAPTYGTPNTQTNVTSGQPGGLHVGMSFDWWNNCGATY